MKGERHGKQAGEERGLFALSQTTASVISFGGAGSDRLGFVSSPSLHFFAHYVLQMISLLVSLLPQPWSSSKMKTDAKAFPPPQSPIP